MGQYYVAVNLDKKEYLHPHACGDGAKLLELGLSSCGLMACLAILLADGNGRGGGDLYGGTCPTCKGHGVMLRKDGKPRTRKGLAVLCKDCKAVGRVAAPEIVGSWAGDRIVLAGDYADPEKFLPEGADAEYRDSRGRTRKHNLYSYLCREGSEYKDVSVEALRALAGDGYARKQLEKNEGHLAEGALAAL